MKTLLIIFTSVTLCIPVTAQTSIHIDFNGLSPEQYSPFIHNTFANHGIQNPERGFEVKAGVIDVYTSDFVPNSDYDYNFMQYQLKGDIYYENIVNGDPSLGISPLGDYLNANFCKDGISLVEIEEYVHFTKDNLKLCCADTTLPINRNIIMIILSLSFDLMCFNLSRSNKS